MAQNSGASDGAKSNLQALLSDLDQTLVYYRNSENKNVRFINSSTAQNFWSLWDLNNHPTSICMWPFAKNNFWIATGAVEVGG